MRKIANNSMIPNHKFIRYKFIKIMNVLSDLKKTMNIIRRKIKIFKKPQISEIKLFWMVLFTEWTQ